MTDHFQPDSYSASSSSANTLLRGVRALISKRSGFRSVDGPDRSRWSSSYSASLSASTLLGGVRASISKRSGFGPVEGPVRSRWSNSYSAQISTDTPIRKESQIHPGVPTRRTPGPTGAAHPLLGLPLPPPILASYNEDRSLVYPRGGTNPQRSRAQCTHHEHLGPEETPASPQIQLTSTQNSSAIRRPSKRRVVRRSRSRTEKASLTKVVLSPSFLSRRFLTRLKLPPNTTLF